MMLSSCEAEAPNFPRLPQTVLGRHLSRGNHAQSLFRAVLHEPHGFPLVQRCLDLVSAMAEDARSVQPLLRRVRLAGGFECSNGRSVVQRKSS